MILHESKRVIMSKFSITYLKIQPHFISQVPINIVICYIKIYNRQGSKLKRLVSNRQDYTVCNLSDQKHTKG